MVSLIIPCFNPGLKLQETLNSLVSQKELVDELILVIDHNHFNNFSKELTDKYSAIFNLKIIRQSDSGRAKSRNKGAEAATGDILLFLDDDMLIEAGLIEKHIQHHVKEEDVILTGNGYRNPAFAINDFSKFLVNMEKRWRDKAATITKVTLDKFTFTACNMSLSRKLFFELDGFDTKFSDGEDFDFAVRALLKGYKVEYDNSLIAWHNDWPEISAFIKRQQEYIKAKKIIFKTHQEYQEYFPEMLPQQYTGIKMLIGIVIRKPLMWLVTPGNVIFANLPPGGKKMLYNYAIAFNSNTDNQ